MYDRFSSLSSMHAPFEGAFIAVVIIVIALELILKGYALWHAARNHQKGWFIVLLIIHTVGVLDAVYLIFFQEDQNLPPVAPPPAAPPAPSPMAETSSVS